MTEGALFWLIVLAVSTLVFFGIAVVVSVRGVGDLRDLLSQSTHRRANK
jgi:uncharacterized membrane protein